MAAKPALLQCARVRFCQIISAPMSSAIISKSCAMIILMQTVKVQERVFSEHEVASFGGHDRVRGCI